MPTRPLTTTPPFACALLLAIGLGGPAAWAQAGHRLDDMVVHPDRNVLLEPMRESAAIEATASVLTAGDLRILQPATASDALKAAPGIHTETRGRKYKQFHSFRGQLYPYPDVVVDGIWQRDARELFYVYPGALLERVEILRSPASLFHGLADVVGVINLVPRQPVLAAEGLTRYTLGAEAGSFNTYRAFGVGEHSPSDIRGLTIGAQAYRTSGRTGRNAAEELTSVVGAFVLQPDPDNRITLGLWALHGYRELETPDPDGPAARNLKNRVERYDPLTYAHVNLRGYHHRADRFSTDWKLFYTDRQARYIRRKIDPAGPGPGDIVEQEDDRELGAQVIQSIALTPDNTLRASVFAHRWTAPDGKQSYTGTRQDISSYALVLSDEQRMGPWLVDAGLRLAQSYFHTFSNPAFDMSGQATQTRPVERRWEDPVLSATLGATLDLNAANRLYTHGGAGRRRPGPGAVQADGTSPDTEQRYTADAGWVMAWGRRHDGQLRLGGFGVWRQDAIVPIAETGVDAAGNEFYFSGNQDIRQHGMEVELQTPAMLRESLSLFSSLTWMRSEQKTGGGYSTYQEIPSVNLSAGARFAAGAWDAALLARHVNRYENFRFSQDNRYHKLGDYWDLSLSAGVRPGSSGNTRLYAIIDNLLDDRYATVVGWSDPGIRVRGGLETVF